VNLLFDLASFVVQHHQPVAGLKVQPELGIYPEIKAKSHCRLRGNRTLTGDDRRQSGLGNAGIFRHAVNAQFQRPDELTEKEFPGMGRFQFLHMLMIVYNFDFVRISFNPLEADAPLLVDPDAVLSLSVSL